MKNNLHVLIHWLEEEVTPERRATYEALDEAGRIAACREILRKNCKALGMRRQDVETIADANVLHHTERLYEKYRHYIDSVESRTQCKKRRRPRG